MALHLAGFFYGAKEMALPNINDLIGSGVTEAGFKSALQQFLENVADLDWINENGLFKPINVLSTATTHVDNYITKGWYIFSSATPAIAAGLPEPSAGFLFVINSGNMVHQKWMPFNSNSEYTRTSNVSAIFPEFQKLITEVALDSALAEYISQENKDQFNLKPYDIITTSKNLYDPSKLQVDKYVNNSGVIATAAGWSCTDFIPVTAGNYYTISSIARRVGAAWYDSSKTLINYIASSANPLTLQAPVGASYLVVNISSTTVTASNVQVEVGQYQTTYEVGGPKYAVDASYLSTQFLTPQKLEIDGDNATVTGLVDGVPVSIRLLLTKDNTHSQSTVFNFSSDYVNGILQRALNDDVAPMRLDGTTIGANHGYAKSNVTLANHGKTAADIGSVWTDGSKQWVVVEIVSASVISLTARNDNSSFATATLTHVSGASNTTSFTPASVTTGLQWYPAIRDRKLSCYLDGAEIDLAMNASYAFKDKVSFLESYSIMKKSDIVEWLIANKGQYHSNYDAESAYTVSFGYTFDQECGCTIYFGGVGRKTIALVDQMITQSIQLAAGNGTVYNYIPKAIEFTAGGYTYNFQNKEIIANKNPSTALFLTAARQDAGTNPIDRIIMLNDQVGYATGYLPVLDAAPDVRVSNASNKYLEIRNSSLKLYPRLIDSASITQINDGDAFAAIAYRKYFKRSTDRTCKYVVRSKLGDYLYLDWHTAKTDEIELPADLIGREFEMVEKSSNVILLSKFASNAILVKIDATKNYGYLVLKFK